MKKIDTRKTAFLGILAALAMTLSFIEVLLPPLPMLPPGFKLGLANIAVMYAVFCLGFWQGIILSVIKSVFILFVNGGYAFVLSMCGSIAAVLVMYLILKLFAKSSSYTAISVAGAVAHNAMQIAAVCVITKSAAALYYAPVLGIVSVLCGGATAAIVKILIPVLKKINI